MSALTRHQILKSAGAAGLGLLAACGRLQWQPPARTAPVGVMSPYAADDPSATGMSDLVASGVASSHAHPPS